MWPWLKRWLDSAMNELRPLIRLGIRPQLLHYSYEKAGLTLSDQPIPWNAEAVLVEAMLRLPPGRVKADFQLVLPDRPPVAAEGLRRDEKQDQHRLFFRLPPPRVTLTAELRYRTTSLGQFTLPILTREEFLTGLRVQLPSLFAQIGGQAIACQTFVSTQCKGLIAGTVLSSPTSLAPLADLGLRVEFRTEKNGSGFSAPATLTSSQLAGRQALVSVTPAKVARKIGDWTASWLAGDLLLHTQRFRSVSLRTFQRSLRVSDTRFLVQSAKGGLAVHRQLPLLADDDRVGPCFLVASGEAGMAGLSDVAVHAVVEGAEQAPLLLDQKLLITDGPTLVAVGTLDRDDLHNVVGFELRAQNQVLGMLSLNPAPAAAFTSEGGFQAPDDYLWTSAAEDELTQRLGKLMGGPGKSGS